MHTHTHMHAHSEILCGHKKGNPDICDNMDETGGHYTKLNKPEREK